MKKRITNLNLGLRNYITSRSMLELTFILAVAVFLTYFNSLFNGFVWDDEEQILNNPLIHNLNNWKYLFSGSTFNSGGGGLSGFFYRPMMPLAFMLNWAVWSQRAFGFHLFQIGLHIANTTLLFRLIWQILKQNKVKQAKLIAFFTCLVWGVHAGISEAVLYIASMQEVLFVFFILISWLIITKTKLADTDWLKYAAAISLAILSKETAAVGIFIGGIYLILFRSKETFWRWLGVSMLVGILYTFMRFGVAKVGISSFSVVPIVKASLVQRLITLPYTLFLYFKLFFWPDKLFISRQFVVRSVFDIRFWGSFLALVGLAAVFIWFYLKTRRKKLYLFLWLIWFLGLSLILNIFPLDMSLAERWLYFPMMALSLIVIWGFVRLVAIKNNFVLLWLIVMATGLLSVRTWIRSFNWRSGLRLYSHDIKLNPDAFDLNNNYGVELYRAGKKQQASRYFRKSTELAPDWWVNWSNLGVVLADEGLTDQAEASYRRSLENGNYYLTYENLTGLLFKQKRYKEVVALGEKGLRFLPANFKLNYLTAIAYYQLGQKDKALNLANRLYQMYSNQQVVDLINLIKTEQK